MKLIVGTLSAYLFLGSMLSPALFCQQSTWRPFNERHPYTTIDDMLNKDAQASDAAGIHYYTEDLAHLVVPDQAEAKYIDSFAGRLAKAEKAAREGKRKLVPESEVVLAFNQLMRKIGAPPSIAADTDKLHQFRAHAAAIGVLPAVLTANRNGSNCNPGEAVYLFWVLINTNGSAPEIYLEGQKAMVEDDKRGGGSWTVVRNSEISSRSLSFLADYAMHRPAHQISRSFNDVAKNLRF